MKNLILYSAIAVAAVSASCNKVKSLANISVDIPYTQQVQVPQLGNGTDPYILPPGGVTIPFPAAPVATGAKGYLNQYHTSSDKVVKVALKGLDLTILAPQGQNFDFLDTVQLYLSAPNLPEILVAYDYSVPKGQTMLNLTATNIDLKSYFLQDTMYFREQMHINAVPGSGTTVNIHSVFNLVANPLY